MAADGSIIVEAELDDRKAQAELNKLTNKIEKLRSQLHSMEEARSPLAEQFENLGVQLDIAKAKLEEMQNAAQGTYTTEQIATQKETVASLQFQWESVGREVEKYDRGIEKANATLAEDETRAGELSGQLTGVGEEGAEAGYSLADAMERATAKVEKLGHRITGLIKRVLFFSIITRALRSFRSYVSSALQTNDEFVAALGRVKGALLTAFQPIYEAIVPALVVLLDILAKVINAIASFIATIAGKSLADYRNSAKGLNDETKALKGVGGAANKAAKQLAHFDEINKLGEEDSGGGGGGASGINPLFGGDDDGLGNYLNGIEEKVTAGLLLGGVALIALGAALMNLGLVIAGLALLGTAIVYGKETGVMQKWAEALGIENVDHFITAGLMIAGIAAIVIGAVLGNVLLLVSGAALIGAGLVYGNKHEVLGDWADKLGLDTVFDYITAAAQLAGIAFIAIGAAMGNIAMVIAGGVVLALGIAADAIGEEKLADFWDKLKLTSVAEWVGVVTTLAGIALIAIGAAMANILMIIAGIGILALGTIANAKENHLRDWVTTLGLEKVVGWVTAALLLGGMALLVIGLVTANIPMVMAGLGLLGAGIAIGITSGTFSSWLDELSRDFEGFCQDMADFANGLAEGFNEVWEGIKEWWKEKIAPVFTKQWWVDKFSAVKDGIKEVLNGLIGHIENAINWIADKLNTIAIDIPPVFGASGAHIGFNLPHVSIPRLASGAVIPPNSEFLAVLGDQKSGTNIETPLETMVAAFKQALSEGAGNRTIVLKVGEREFASMVFDVYNTESGRVGVSMVR